MELELFDLHAAVEGRHWWFVGRRQIVRSLVERVLPPGAGGRVVDVGCGTGANIASFADRYDVVGIDTSPKAIEWSRNRFDEVEFICGEAPEDLGAHLADVDAFLLMDVLEHLPEPKQLLNRLVESLPSGGFVVITVPADMRLWSQHDESFGHFRRYDTASLRDLWKGLPVREILVSHFNSRLYPLVFGIRKLTAWRGRAWGKAGSDLSVPPALMNEALTRVFAGESARLLRVMEGRRAPFRRGVSLVAILQRSA